MAHSFEELDVQGDNAREVLPACREAVGISLGKSTESRTAGDGIAPCHTVTSVLQVQTCTRYKLATYLGDSYP